MSEDVLTETIFKFSEERLVFIAEAKKGKFTPALVIKFMISMAVQFLKEQDLPMSIIADAILDKRPEPPKA